MANKYNLYCIVCKKPIEGVRRDIHTCSDMCRLALSNLYKKIEEDTSGLTPEELKTYKKFQARIKGEGKVVKTITAATDEPEDEENEPKNGEEEKTGDEKTDDTDTE